MNQNVLVNRDNHLFLIQSIPKMSQSSIIKKRYCRYATLITRKIFTGMPKLNVYLNFAGNTEEAFKFYRSVFGGEFAGTTRFKDMPASPELQRGEQASTENTEGLRGAET